MGNYAARPSVGVGVPLALALIHIAVVAPRYHVGSFDDDAAYLVMARGILHGVGLGGYLAHHVALLDAYPPGYPLLLAPLLWLFGDSTYLAERLASAICMAAVFPLTWLWLGRRRVPGPARAVVGLLLAASPLIATYGSMVMAEAPFLVVLIGLLISAERWVDSGRSWCPSAVATVALVVMAIWLKEAALGFLPGLVLWLAWRRRWLPATVAAIAGAAGLAPLIIGRLATGVPIAGARYASELGSYYQGGLLHRVALVPLGVAEWCFDALPSAIVPTGSPLSSTTGLFVVFRGLACATTALFVVVGTVTWIRRRGADLAVFVVLAYAFEVCLYKYVNDRRALLVLPVALTWYVIGAAQTYLWVLARIRRLHPLASQRWRRGVALWGLVAVAGPLAVQFPTDYRYDLGQSSPAPAGSPYMALLSQLGGPSQVVETTFLWSTSLLSQHATDNAAAISSAADCNPGRVAQDLRADDAAYLLTAAIDIPGQVDSPCLEKVAAASSWAVPLLQTPVDDATVYELVGPQSAQPNMRSLVSIVSTTLKPPTPPLASPPPPRTTSSWHWSLPAGATVRQVSVGGVAALSGSTGKVAIRLREGKHWRTVASAAGPIGQSSGTPFLLATLPKGTAASAVQISVAATGPVTIQNLAVLGVPAPPKVAAPTKAPAPRTRSGPAKAAAGAAPLR